jgi:tRNA threonylcarbamoyladenosine biosynthesis protein TsaE
VTFEITIHNPAELPLAAKTILDGCAGKKVFAFSGELGSGKTAIIKAICRELGVYSKAVSPSFAIVNEYSGPTPAFHIDLYRLNNLNEALDVGIEEYLASGNYCFIEWPEVIKNLLPQETVTVKISVGRNNERFVNVDTNSSNQISKSE